MICANKECPNVQKSLSLKLIIKSIVQMNAAELPRTGASWKSTMKRKLFVMEHIEPARNAMLN